MRILITGSSGFVGSHMALALTHACGAKVAILATSKTAMVHPTYGIITALNVLDRAAVSEAVQLYAPTHILHLAGIASPAAANANPRLAWDAHLGSVLNLSDAIREHAPECWLMHVGTGMVYGASAKSGEPLDEDTPLAPMDCYAASKAGADLALGAMSHGNLKCIRFRPFNHSGPRQSEDFVIPAFAMQIARIEAGLAAPVLRVGNLDAERDFLDVRDVAAAYALATQQTASLGAGTILNIASGIPRRVGDILDALLVRARVPITVSRDPRRMRPSELPRIVGDAQRARAALRWSPRYEFHEMIADVLEYARSRVCQS